VVLALVLIPVNTYWLAVVELVRNTSTPTSVSLFFNAVLTLTCVAAANAALRRVAPRAALSHGEVAAVYVMVAVGSAMGGIDVFCCMPPVAAYPFRYARPENGWLDLFCGLLPRHLVVSDADALAGFWQGSSSLYRPENWRPWLWPVLGWNVFALGLVGVWLGLTSLFSPRWIGSERLTYPISQLPAEISLSPRRLVTSGPFLIGLTLSAGIALLNGLHTLKPAVPMIPVKSTATPAFNISAQIVDRPWSAVGALLLSFYPFAIGLSILLPTKLSMSCWVFYLLFKLQHILSNQALSWTSEGAPFTREQSLGAYIGLAVFSFYMSRAYLGRQLAAALGRRAAHEPGDRPMSGRLALLLSLGCLVFVIGFGRWAGMTWSYSSAFFLLYTTLSYSFTRIRAEMGVPTHELHLVAPHQVLARWAGSRTVGPKNLAVGTTFYWFNYAHRSHPMPQMAEGLKIADRGHVSQSAVAALCVLAAVVGALSSCWAILHIYYRDGAAAKWGPGYAAEWIAINPYTELAHFLREPTGPDKAMIWASVTGFCATFALMGAHTRIGWWPLHPVGYAVANAWAMDHMWFSIFVAWVLKSITARYGGAPSVRRLTALAFGLVMGDYLAGGTWSLYGTARGIRAYSIWV